MTTQSITYRDGKHMYSLSIDMNDPADVEFIEQFKRVPSKNRDYIAALYAREKKRGINRHIGDTIQPLSLVKQMDEPDVQKSRLTIDKNSLMDTLKRIDEKRQEIQADIDSGKRTKEDAEIELKSLEAEREKIKARADELGIKIAALNAKSSADGSSPLKPDQLITIIKKLQEKGSNVDLSPVLNELRNFRIDKVGGMNAYMSLLIDMMDKTFVYESGRSLDLSKVKSGLEVLNKALTGKRITGNKTAAKRVISEALDTVMTIYNTPVGDITVRSGIEMEAGVAAALFKRLFMTLLMAIDFDVKDIDISTADNEFIDTPSVARYLTEIHNAVDESTHLYSGFKQLDVPSESVDKYTNIAKNIVKYIKQAAAVMNRAGNGYVLNICAIVLGIQSSKNVNSFKTIYPIHEQLIAAYNNSSVDDAYNAFKAINQQKNYSKKTIHTAFNAVKDATAKLITDLTSMQDTIPVGYEQSNNTLIINNARISSVFGYIKKDTSENIISVDITVDTIVERLKRQHFPKNIQRSPETVEISPMRDGDVKDASKYVEFETLTENMSPDPPVKKEKFSLMEKDDERSEATTAAAEAGDYETLRKRQSYIKALYDVEEAVNVLTSDDVNRLAFHDLINKRYKPESVKTGRFTYETRIVPKVDIKMKTDKGKGIAGYIKVIDRGNPLMRRRM